MAELLTLNADNLTSIGGRLAVDVPRYARVHDKRICHIGIGRFHRAHQADYLHRLLQAGTGEGWGIVGIGLRATDLPVIEILRSQDYLYSLWQVTASSKQGAVIGSIMDCIDASADSAQAVAAMSDAATRIISLTVTEAGYCLDAKGDLDTDHPDIAHDLAGPARLRSAAGLITRALAARRAAGHGAVTLMSCDNLIENGHQLRRTVLGFARHTDAALAGWIEANVSFPCSMVDRITPAHNARLQQELCEAWGVSDEALIMCEDWQQWVIEDHFVAGRPAFEQAGAVMSDRVKDYENMKVGLLNGGHSALSHVGLLCDHTLVHKALESAPIRQWMADYMKQVETALTPIPGVDFGDYEASLIRRFSNPAIEDRLARLAQDSSAKFPQNLLPPLLWRLQNGMAADGFAATIALWIFYLDQLRVDAEMNQAYLDVRKDELIELAAAAMAAMDAGPFLAATLALPAPHAETFRAIVSQHLRGLREAGVMGHVTAYLAGQRK